MNLVFLGKVGVGKTAYAQHIAERLGLVVISTGELIRREIFRETPLGKKVSSLVKQGKPIDDLMVSELVGKRLGIACILNGFILDGFPYNSKQAKKLEEMLAKKKEKIDAVVYFDAGEKILAERVCGRIQCMGCGTVYHKTFFPPSVPGLCDQDAQQLYQRADDKLEVARKRWKRCEKNIKPVLAYYSKKNLLVKVNAEGNVKTVSEQAYKSIMKFLRK